MARQQRPIGKFQAIWPPALLALAGLPLALEMVPPNAFYGVRTAMTLASADVWYRANFWAGVVAVIAGMAAIRVNLLILGSPRMREDRKIWYILGTTLMAAAAMVAAGLAAS